MVACCGICSYCMVGCLCDHPGKPDQLMDAPDVLSRTNNADLAFEGTLYSYSDAA